MIKGKKIVLSLLQARKKILKNHAQTLVQKTKMIKNPQKWNKE
jgi:hypothetical protein